MYPSTYTKQDREEAYQELKSIISQEGYKVFPVRCFEKITFSFEYPSGWKSMVEWDEEREVYQFLYESYFQ